MSLSLSLSVVSPLFIYILVGVVSVRLHWIDEDTAVKMNRFTYKVFFPMLVFNNVVAAGSSFDEHFVKTMWFVLLSVTALFILLMLLVPLFIKDRRRQGSIIQGAYRGNTLLFALTIVQTICGDQIAAEAAVCMTVYIPFSNIFCVVALETRRGGTVSLGSIIKGVIANPLIIAAALGGVFLLLGIELPPLIAKPVNAMASMVMPLSLVLLGVGLKLKGILRDASALIGVCMIKLVLFPLASVLAARWMGFTGGEFTTIFAMSCVPTAVSSFTMAEAMDADGPLAGEIVAATTILSLVTVFLWVLVLSELGMFN